MVSLDLVKASNAQLKELGPNLVALFGKLLLPAGGRSWDRRSYNTTVLPCTPSSTLLEAPTNILQLVEQQALVLSQSKNSSKTQSRPESIL